MMRVKLVAIITAEIFVQFPDMAGLVAGFVWYQFHDTFFFGFLEGYNIIRTRLSRAAIVGSELWYPSCFFCQERRTATTHAPVAHASPP